MDKPRIGFIGLGVMGLPMAGHLGRAGYALTAYDINDAPMQRLKAKYPDVNLVGSPEKVASMADIVITMLPSGREVRAVVLGPEGVLQGLKPGGLLLDTSSSEPEFTKEVSTALAASSITMVDAPVSGAEAGAIAAEPVFMVGGDAADVARVQPRAHLATDPQPPVRRSFQVRPDGQGHDHRVAPRSGAGARPAPLEHHTHTVWQEAQASISKGSSVSAVVRVLENRTGVQLTSEGCQTA